VEFCLNQSTHTANLPTAGHLVVIISFMSSYYETYISAETQEQADTILDKLLAMRLVTGGQFLQSPARFLWKGEVVNMSYITITSFTTAEKKNLVAQCVESVSLEEIPMVRFVPIEANDKLTAWIDHTLS
jgi:uncharacterized protein involved in tolerance to divalent cations